MNLPNLPLAYYTYSGLWNCLVASVVTIVVLRQKGLSASARLFVRFSWLFVIWSLFYFLWLSETAHAFRADFFERACMIPIVLMPPTFLHFASVLTHRWRHSILHRANYALAGITCLLIYTPLFSPGVSSYHVFPFWLIPGPIFPVHLFQMFGSAGCGLWLIAKTARTSDKSDRPRLWWLFWAYLSGFLSGFTNYLAWYRLAPPLLNPVAVLHIVAIAYAIVRHRLFGRIV